jgi:hypothetical protein
MDVYADYSVTTWTPWRVGWIKRSWGAMRTIQGLAPLAAA